MTAGFPPYPREDPVPTFAPAPPVGAGQLPDRAASFRAGPAPDRVAIPRPAAPFDQSAALWMRAFPRRWRLARGAEVAEVLRDLAAPGADRLDLRSALGLLRAGWVVRLRQRPPLHTYVLYRFFNRRIPARHREWARDDIEGRFYRVREMLLSGLFFLAVFTRASLNGSMPWSDFWFFVTAFFVLSAAVDPAARREALTLTHLTVGPGEPWVAGALVAGQGPRHRLDARSGLLAAVVVAGVAAVGWGAALALARTGILLVDERCPDVTDPQAMCSSSGVGTLLPSVHLAFLVLLAVAAVVGLASIRLVRRRLAQLVPLRPGQERRVVVPMAARSWSATAIWCGAIVVEAWFEGSGRFIPLVSWAAGPIALALLPGTVTAWLVVRRLPRTDGPPLALVDVRRIAALGRPPRVDVARAAPVVLMDPGALSTVRPVIG